MATNTNSTHILTGRITDLQDKPLEGLIVRAYDQDPKTPPNLLGMETTTGSDGSYTIRFTDEDYRIGGMESGGPDVYIEVYKRDEPLGKSPVKRNSKKHITINLKIDYAIPVPDGPAWQVRGTVRDAGGDPIPSIAVQAYDRDLRAEQWLGKGMTNQQGIYQIEYYAHQIRRREKGSADIVVKALSGSDGLLAASNVLFNAPPVAELDLTIPAETFPPQSLFEKISRTLVTLLDGLPTEELEEKPDGDSGEKDLSFLTGETGFDMQTLARFALAHKLAMHAIKPEFWFALLRAPFYEYTANQSLVEQFTTVLRALPKLNAAAVQKALISSFNQNEISANYRAREEEWLAEFLTFAAAQYVNGAGQSTFVKLALEDAGIDQPEKQEKFARLFNEHKALTPELIEALEKDRHFKQEEIEDLRTSFRLAEIIQVTGNNFSSVKVLKDDFGIHTPEKIQNLAKKSESEWVEWAWGKGMADEDVRHIRESGLEKEIMRPIAQVYGKTLERQFREAFPTAAFTGGLERALHDTGPRGLKRGDLMLRFLESNENFDLLHTRVDDFLKKDLSYAERALAKDENFALELKAVQRVYKLAPTFEAADTLLADNLHSAQMIYRMGQAEFARAYADQPGFTEEIALLTWSRAADTHAAVVTVIADLVSIETEATPLALRNINVDLSTFPNWNNLFRAGDICECEHCRSVISPAAYYADMLMFLKDRRAANPGETVKEVLFRRRADLGYLELNCDNALVTLPYIDVVCEVLERVVAGQANDIELVGFTAMPAAPGEKAAVQAAFSAANILLGADFSLSQVDSTDPDRWVVHSDETTYLLRKNGTPNFFAQILPNTKASAAEMRAYPQYLDPEAYKILRQQKYPIALPFDLFAEEVRAAFQKSGLQRWDLMRTLQGAAAPNNPTPGQIAAEYFGISADPGAAFDEKRLILDAKPNVADQQAIWSVAGANWLSDVSVVKTFLDKTGLEYNQLLELLDLKFISPAGDITIQHLDPSCDTDQKTIQALDAAKLDRLHRFLRMWRKLKDWKMWELDLVIDCIGSSALDEPFLVNLFYFCEVRKKLGAKVSVEQVCALFDDLNTQTHFSRLHEKRQDALYQGLFLNRRLIQPLDPAFQLDIATGDLPVGETLTIHQPAILATLGISESNLQVYKGLTRATNGATYINDNLNLANLSFLWRHTWLAKALKFKAEDWKVLLKIFNRDLLDFSSPQVALKFLEDVEQLKLTGFNLDEINWLLDADRSAKAAVKESDAARFLLSLRQELQGIQAEFDPAQYSFLTVTPPSDTDSLTALLITLLQRLGRDETAAQFFVSVLQDEIFQEKPVADLPASFNFPPGITGAPNNIPIRYEPAFYFDGAMTAAQRTILLNDASLWAVTGILAYQQAIQSLFSQPGKQVIVTGLPPGFSFPPAITGAPNNIPIQFRPMLFFTGWMTVAQQTTLLNDPLLVAVTGIGPYQEAINTFFGVPRLALKFFEPMFTAPLANLPDAVDFKILADTALVQKISYDAEQKLLRFAGVMTSAEKIALDALSADGLYRNAVNSLSTQPGLAAAPDARIWLLPADLQFPLRDLTTPANDNLTDNLTTAIIRALNYLSKSLAEKAVIQQSSPQLGLSEALTRRLFSDYAAVPGLPPPAAPPPATLLEHLTGAFTATNGVVDYATRKSTFDGWFWAHRAAAVWKKWKISPPELDRLAALTIPAQLLDLLTLPQDVAGAIASLDQFMRTARLLRIRDSLPETNITLLEVLTKLNAGGYANSAAFASDVEGLNEDWSAVDMEALVNALDLTYPADYLQAENWERLRRAFYFIDSLNAGANAVKGFAAAAMMDTHVKTLKELLRAKFGPETWETLCTEIQDVLRERKRDALVAYLLTLPKPADAPTGKWENTNDLYAYYLLDVEMNSCQLTSRLVQASGSVQLFVQRCFMGLEPDVIVQADGPTGDSAWRWWKWMRKYRVWEANRKVFLWPENWIEPELKKDRSQFFRDLENELLQNEINEYTVETAFQNYLQKLDGVAQLEIAGFHQEDDGDNAIIHVFGRTTGAEPHLYYYRCYDYRQWTPWEKVELDIQGDYLIPAVINNRLFLFWPVFTEVPDEAGNKRIKVPGISNAEQNVDTPLTWKKLRLQMAVSDYRRGKWSPKKISTSYEESAPYTEDIVRKEYVFYFNDRSEIDGRFSIEYGGNSISSDGKIKIYTAYLNGAFEIGGCNGVPQTAYQSGYFIPSVIPELASTGGSPSYMKWEELTVRQDQPENDFTLINTAAYIWDSGWGWDTDRYLMSILDQTPGLFKMTIPWHLSYIDKLMQDGELSLSFFSDLPFGMKWHQNTFIRTGSWLPFFYNDKKRTFFVLSAFGSATRGETMLAANGEGIQYYPEIKRAIREMEVAYAGQVHTWLESVDLSAFNSDQRDQLESFFQQGQLSEEAPPYTDGQLKAMTQRFIMRFIHLYLGAYSYKALQHQRFHFKNFYHPFVCDFANLVYNPLKGISALMSRETQLKNSGFHFLQSYQPTVAVIEPGTEEYYPEEVVDFTPDGAYAPYNWELFFHVPLLIANSLSKDQRFEEARDWYHFMFNPLGLESAIPGGSPMSKYWITKPFFETTDPQYVQQRIENILRMLAGDTSVPGYSSQLKQALEDQVLDWRTNPFEPHRIASYRTVAYQKTVVMKYLDNLIAWGDNLFGQDSMESINEATQLYILAAEILGPRPRRIPPQARPLVETFNELEKELDKFSNALVQVENLVPVMSGTGQAGADPAPIPLLYFCIPQNEKLLGYWDTVADRLYKIRNCMNIEGVVRQLALFEPPIDPGALVKAVAGGVDISSALADLNAPLPLYRFNSILQKAKEVCNDVRALGGSLLAALEKKDAEELGLLRQNQEIHLLEAMKAIRENQINEAKENLAGLRKNKELVTIRRDFYLQVEKISASETLQQSKLSEALTWQQTAQVINIGASVAHYIPSFNIGIAGVGGSPNVGMSFGGSNVGSALQAAAGGFTFVANVATYDASKASTDAGQDRRWDDWKLQEKAADKELEQIDRSIAAAELRITITEKELDNQVLQIENAKATNEFMRSKYTNEELYQWQVGQISGVYFQSYRLAYDLAKRAERCYRFELGLQDSSYINFGYWDSLKKGLLSGEKLQYDLHRLETIYLEQNRREYELTKHVSLALLDPLALVQLRETGRCFIRLPEEIFDLDYPGHYFRRIKSVSLTLPCVAGPYTTVSCTLRLVKNSIRINTANGDNGYPRNTDEAGLPTDDGRFIENNISAKATAASTAQNDSGVFELSFRDERYLPLEGAGVISDWSLELFSDLPSNNPDPANPDFGKPLRQFDYGTISDAILQIRYTAREDAGSFKNYAITHLREYFARDGATPSLSIFNLRQEFPSQWQRFLQPTNPANGNVFELEMSPNLFPIRDKNKNLKLNRIWLLARCTNAGNYGVIMTPPLPAPPPAGSNAMTLTPINLFGGMHANGASGRDVSGSGIQVIPTTPPVKWQIRMTRPGGGNLQEDPAEKVMEVKDLILVLGYEWE
jgi:hypothetical protein